MNEFMPPINYDIACELCPAVLALYDKEDRCAEYGLNWFEFIYTEDKCHDLVNKWWFTLPKDRKLKLIEDQLETLMEQVDVRKLEKENLTDVELDWKEYWATLEFIMRGNGAYNTHYFLKCEDNTYSKIKSITEVDSEFTKITDFVDKGLLYTYNVVLENGKSIKVSKEHKFLVRAKENLNNDLT